MILNDPCFQRKLKTYLLTIDFDSAVVVAESPERAKEIMVHSTNNPTWFDAEDFKITITGKEQIVYGSVH